MFANPHVFHLCVTQMCVCVCVVGCASFKTQMCVSADRGHVIQHFTAILSSSDTQYTKRDGHAALGRLVSCVFSCQEKEKCVTA